MAVPTSRPSPFGCTLPFKLVESAKSACPDKIPCAFCPVSTVNRQETALTRRSFVQAGAATVLTAASWRRVWGANERVGVGFIGYGLIGKRHVLDFQAQPDAQLLAVAEVHSGRLKEATALIGGAVKGHADFRHLLDSKDVQAVVVSTPDHWHALHTMLA